MGWFGRMLSHLRSADLIRWSQLLGLGRPVEPTYTEDNLPTAYAANPWVYAAVHAIASSAATVPLQVVQDVPDADPKPLLDHPAVAVLKYVNGEDNQYTLVEAITSDLCLSGNAYVNLLRPRPTAAPVGMQVLPPDKVRAVPGIGRRSKLVSGYTVWEGGVETTLPDSDVLHFKLFGLSDQYYGASPLKCLTQTLNSWSYNATTSEKFFKRGGLPSGILSVRQMLDETQRKGLKEDWRRWRTPEAADVPLVLGNDMQYTAVGSSPDSVISLSYPNALREQILAVLGVPNVIVGLETANYATAQVERQLFWQETVCDYLSRVETTLTEQFLPEFGEKRPDVRIAFDLSGVEVLREDEVKAADVESKRTGTFAQFLDCLCRSTTLGVVTIAEARALAREQAAALGVEEKTLKATLDQKLPWSESWWGSFSTTEIASVNEPVNPKPEPAPVQEPPAVPPPVPQG